MARPRFSEREMRRLMVSREVQRVVRRAADRVAAVAGDGFEAQTSQRRPRRARAVVIAATPKAARTEAKRPTLLPAMASAGLRPVRSGGRG